MAETGRLELFNLFAQQDLFAFTRVKRNLNVGALFRIGGPRPLSKRASRIDHVKPAQQFGLVLK